VNSVTKYLNFDYKMATIATWISLRQLSLAKLKFVNISSWMGEC